MSVKTYFLVLVLLSLLSVCWNIPVSVSTSDPTTFSPPSALTLSARVSSDDPPSMKEEYRTIWGIILESGKTIVACSWTAVHINIPDPKIGRWKYWQKFYIMCYAILVPEAILVWALRQRVAAGVLAKRYNEALDLGEGERYSLWSRFLHFLGCATKEEDENADRRWTNVHGFYVQMGGFILYQDDKPLHVLTCDDLIELVQHKSIEPLKISQEEIDDKSKSSWYSKLAAMAQIAFFVGKVGVYRWIRHLPTTHLELAVICLCCLSVVTSIFWLDKPLDVDVATPVRLIEAGKQVLEAGVQVPEAGKQVLEAGEQVHEAEEQVHEAEEQVSGAGEQVPGAGGVGEDTAGTGSDGTSESTHSVGSSSGSATVVDTTEELNELAERTRSHVWLLKGIRKDWSKYRKGEQTKIEFFIRFLSRLWCAVFRPFAKLADDDKEHSGSLRVPMFGAAKVEEVSREILIFFAVVLVAGTVFGSGHLIAWGWHFPTTTERTLWRVCGLITTAGPLFTCMIVVVSEVTTRVNASREERKALKERKASEEGGEASERGEALEKDQIGALEIIWIVLVDGLGLGFVKYVTAPAYIVARAIMVVLMFTTLRSLPIEVLQGLI